jgi:hypothetical protein
MGDNPMAKAPKHPMPELENPFPSPPFPDPDNEILRIIMERVMAAYEAGQVDVSGAVLDAAVHAWYEGHIQGEDACPGCNYRGQLPKQSLRGWLPQRTTTN